MTYYPIILVDSGILVAYYSSKDRYHQLGLHRQS